MIDTPCVYLTGVDTGRTVIWIWYSTDCDVLVTAKLLVYLNTCCETDSHVVCIV